MHASVVSSVNLCLYIAEEIVVLRAVTIENAAADAWNDTASLAFASNNDDYAAATSSEVFQLNPIVHSGNNHLLPHVNCRRCLLPLLLEQNKIN